ncbi:MAG: F0F1 ATP synthase subunit A [Flavobacteriales bacterium]|nr:F0F1 ATP synthase subunit A [Flavobacteriales bacterium]
MSIKNISKFTLILFVFLSINSFANTNETHEENIESTTIVDEKASLKKEIKETIDHHLMDSYDFAITHGVSFPLPVILIDGGLHIFSSSKLTNHDTHEPTIVESNGNYYKLFHGKIYKTDAAGTINLDEHHHATNEKPFDISITKNVFTIILMSLFLFFLFKGMAKKYKTNSLPKGAGRFLEPIVLFVRDEIAIPNIGEKHYKKYMNYLLTIFFFIWFLNLAGMTPFGIGVTNNIAVTFSLAMLTFLITQFTGKKTYWLHLFDPLGHSMPWVAKIPLYLLLVPIEILGLFVKPFSLMIRLYANMTAGHVVLMSIIGLIFVFKNIIASTAFPVLTLALSALELLVAALQAYIFTMLSALYFGTAAEEHH